MKPRGRRPACLAKHVPRRHRSATAAMLGLGRYVIRRPVLAWTFLLLSPRDRRRLGQGIWAILVHTCQDTRTTDAWAEQGSAGMIAAGLFAARPGKTSASLGLLHEGVRGIGM